VYKSIPPSVPSGGSATKELITILIGDWKVVGRETLCLEKLSGESRDDELETLIFMYYLNGIPVYLFSWI
jgi:hypothetical protein